MANSPMPITLTQADTYTGPGAPKPMVVIGELNTLITPAAFVEIDATPADATAVATDLISLRDELIGAGLIAAS